MGHHKHPPARQLISSEPERQSRLSASKIDKQLGPEGTVKKSHVKSQIFRKVLQVKFPLGIPAMEAI